GMGGLIAGLAKPSFLKDKKGTIPTRKSLAWTLAGFFTVMMLLIGLVAPETVEHAHVAQEDQHKTSEQQQITEKENQKQEELEQKRLEEEKKKEEAKQK